MSSSPIKISYTDDEVNVFHPIIENELNQFLSQNQLETIYEIEHHPNTSSGGIPDFVIKEKISGKWVFVIEVKRTPSSVQSNRFWNQARDYVVDNMTTKWSSGKHPLFMITNLELSYFLCDRTNAAVQFCLLKNGEISCPKFGDDAIHTISKFRQETIPKIFDLIQTQQPDFSDHLKLILHDYVGLQGQLSTYIQNTLEPLQIRNTPQNFGFTDLTEYLAKMDEWRTLNDPRETRTDFRKIARELARDSLLRILLYEYCREYFRTSGQFTTLKPIQINTLERLTTSITECLRDLENIDFSQILRERLMQFVPENIDDNVFQIFRNFLDSLQKNITETIKENGMPYYLLNNIIDNNELYPWEELNGDGKVMTDALLSDFVTEICFKLCSKDQPNVFDPGCGTGNFLSSVYDKIRSYNLTSSHNEILSHLHGCEVDTFLGKLGVFGLTMRSPTEVDTNTKIDIRFKDFFEIPPTDLNKYDMVIMNPPFLRNDNKVLPLYRTTIENKIFNILGTTSFMKNTSQPNFFFYFVELATNLLEENGIAGFFLMKSFLNTENGEHLKNFLLKNFELHYIISVPWFDFFTTFMVSPCLIFGKRKLNPTQDNEVKFVRVVNSNFFNRDYYHELTEGTNNGEFRVVTKKQSQLDPKENWKQWLLTIPEYYDIFENSASFSSLGISFNDIQRGGLASEGSGSPFFFPWSNGDAQHKMPTEISGLEKRFMRLGLNNSDIPSNYMLTHKDLEQQQVLAIPQSTDVQKYTGLQNFLQTFVQNFTRPKRWHIDDFPANAQLIVPRASRKFHSVLFNPFWDSEKVNFSSNFVCLWNCNITINGLTTNDVVKFVAGFLNSSFGQMMFEVESQDREGLRKIERGKVSDRLFIPTKNLSSHVDLVKEVITQFETLQFGLTGLESYPTPRQSIDTAIAKLLFAIEPDFDSMNISADQLAERVERDLRELVRDRKNI